MPCFQRIEAWSFPVAREASRILMKVRREVSMDIERSDHHWIICSIYG
jgi:hypothetical protein